MAHPIPSPAGGLRKTLVVLAALATSLALVFVWHLLGRSAAPRQAGYPFTQYLTTCIEPAFVAAFAMASVGLAWITGARMPVVVGLLLPLPMALVAEMALDPTSHNLLPFEVILLWVPAFLVALVGTGAGSVARRLARGTGRPPPFG